MTNGSTSNNHHPLPPRDDRETLSALFDGELPGDAMRFAMKRLDHDAEWRDTCGRWQMIGDTLRGEAMRAAPTGFATGVMRMLAAEEQEAIAISAQPVGKVAPPAAGLRRRWMGGAALAASVAVAAVLAVRPFQESSVSAPEGQVASGVSAPAPAVVPAAPASDVQAPAATPAPAPAPPAIAAATPPPATERRPTPRAMREAARPARNPVATTGQTATPDTAVAATAPASNPSPFHPPVDDIVTRPWPRSVLSDSTAGALTVGLGSTSPATPSLYPFEPRLPQSEPVRPQPAEPQQR